MNESIHVAGFFDAKANSFDAIYSGKKSVCGRAFDRLARRNIQERFDYTFKELGSLMGKTVLDAGCGSGRYCIEAARRGARRVVGLDVSEKMLTLARKLARDEGAACEFLPQDIFSFSAGKFDAVTAIGFFDYIRDASAAMAKLRTLCGSVLVASFPARSSFRVPFRKLYLNLSGCPVYFYSASQVEALAVAAGFRIRRLERRGPIYLLVAETGESGAKTRTVPPPPI